MHTHQTVSGGIPGLRKITPALRQAEDYARQWLGLPDGASKAGLLRLLEDVPAVLMGISTRERSFLHHLVKKQPSECFKSAVALKGCDLECNALALVSTYSDVHLTAELGVTSRTLARWRDQVSAAGWIAFRDSADRTRYRVGPADAPSEAYGIDLRPLVVRYSELERLRDQATARQKELIAVQKTLSIRRTRLRSLEALAMADQPLAFVETALKAVEAVRKGKDLDHAKMALAQIDGAIVQLEGQLDAAPVGFFGVTKESGAPDKTGAQLPPTHPNQKLIGESLLGRGAQQEEGWVSGGTSDSIDACADNEDDGEEEVVWQSSTVYEDCETSPVVVTVQPKPRSTRYTPRINTPSPGEVLMTLPEILARKDFPFTRHPSFPTDRSLVIAYGLAAASRVGLTRQEVKTHSSGANDLAFAVAALLAEFSDDVRNRRAYLLGLIGRINDPVIRVDLWASWQRLNRVKSLTTLPRRVW